jgi:hypothetical protein
MAGAVWRVAWRSWAVALKRARRRGGRFVDHFGATAAGTVADGFEKIPRMGNARIEFENENGCAPAGFRARVFFFIGDEALT